MLMIATSVPNVTLNYGASDEKPIRHMTTREAEEYILQGHFEFASMLPKIQAAIDFIRAGKGRSAIVTTLEKALDSIDGKAGTIIGEDIR